MEINVKDFLGDSKFGGRNALVAKSMSRRFRRAASEQFYTALLCVSLQTQGGHL